MALSIKNPLAETLARKLAKESGEKMTTAIIKALQERLERLQGRSATTDLSKEIIAISKRCSALPNKDKRLPDQILGYNDTGAFT